jgi:hypothetical protein
MRNFPSKKIELQHFKIGSQQATVSNSFKSNLSAPLKISKAQL